MNTKSRVHLKKETNIFDYQEQIFSILITKNKYNILELTQQKK